MAIDKDSEFIDSDYLEGQLLLLDENITAHVEGLDDVCFWEDIFRKFAPNLKINFNIYSRDNHLKNGKQEVLKRIEQTSHKVILCVDSDSDYLLKNEPVYDHPFIFQTYTYAIENYKIFPYNLNIIAKKCSLPDNPNFCFIQFFVEYSRIIYNVFLYWIYFEKERYEALLDILHNY